MRIVIADWESYYCSKTYTLKKMSTEAYLRDPRFEAHGCAIKWQHNIPARWYDQREIKHIMAEEDWSDVFMIHHHAQFDAGIESFHYDCHPKMIGCTMAMSRLMLGAHVSASLDNVRKHFGLHSKVTPYGLFDGKHWNEIAPQAQAQIADGACDEVESIWIIFQKFMEMGFPVEEFEIIDHVVKMFSEPMLQADTTLLGQIWEREEKSKVAHRQALNVAETDLQSADKFSKLLEAEGIEIETKNGKKGPIPCFAKTDDFMRGLLEHDNPRVRTLAEARLGEKSTFMQTRAETLGWTASRGALPVYLNYAGAGTLRVSGGDKCNWLNFKRNSDIRRSILAPEGYLLAPVDSSQIECRCLHYLAGGPDEPVIKKFRNKEDPYVDLPSVFYKETVYKPKKGDPRFAEMEAKRGMGKQGRLMCLGPDTIVLTNAGHKFIVDVSITDLLWDGVEWVTHQGLIFQGEQNVVELKGVRMTSDHQILCGIYGWQPAASVIQNENILFQALENASENLPSQAMSWELKTVLQISLFNVLAALRNIRLIQQIFMRGAQRDATLALKKKPGIGLKNTMDMLTSAPMNRIAGDYCAASPLFTTDAVQTVKTNGMADAAFKSVPSGGAMAADVNFWHTWLRFPAGISRSWKSIERIITKVINRVTFNLLRARDKCEIGEASNSSKMKLPTFDISLAGPRNRFTILSRRGPMIVHNCGYGASGKQFKITAKNGLYGPSVDISLEDSNAIVALYRETNPSVCARNTGYWAQAERMIARLAGGAPVDWGPLHVRDGRIYLPNGAMMVYDSLEFHRPNGDEEVRDFERDGYWRMRTRFGWKKMWGSKLTQNICEAVSRVIVSQALIRCARMGYRALNWPYDELLFLIPRDGHEQEHLQRCKAEMVREPTWLPGLPLDVEGELSERYSK